MSYLDALAIAAKLYEEHGDRTEPYHMAMMIVQATPLNWAEVIRLVEQWINVG